VLIVKMSLKVWKKVHQEVGRISSHPTGYK